MNYYEEIKELWPEFVSLPFPEHLVDAEVPGICLVTLDTFTAGCIDSYIDGGGLLEEGKINILKESRKDLQVVVENLNSEDRAYFEKLLIMTNKILADRESKN